MVAKSDPDAKPRRDGMLERRGTWAEVTVGSVLAGPKRADAFEVIASAHGPQIIDEHTLWFRVRNHDGVEHTIQPRPKTNPVTFLLPNDEATLPARTPAADAEAMALLVEKLGARHIATLDRETGEVTAPDYANGEHHSPETPGERSGIIGIDEIEHLEVMHGIDVSGLRGIVEHNDRMIRVAQIHGGLHAPRSTNATHSGVPHRHVSTS